MTLYLSVRYRRGIVGETHRSVHLVPMPVGDVPTVLVSLCDTKFGPDQAELLHGIRGMPCVACEVLAASRQAGLQPALTSDEGRPDK